MICDRCQKMADKTKDSLTSEERIFITTAVASLMRQVTDSTNKMVGSSVTTKMLLSFPPGQRSSLLQIIRKSTGFSVSIDDCPHTALVVN